MSPGQTPAIRSGGGCGTCKTRKIKCDQRRPNCLRCETQRLECPGYQGNVLRWSVKHQVALTSETRPSKRIKTANEQISPPTHNVRPRSRSSGNGDQTLSRLPPRSLRPAPPPTEPNIAGGTIQHQSSPQVSMICSITPGNHATAVTEDRSHADETLQALNESCGLGGRCQQNQRVEPTHSGLNDYQNSWFLTQFDHILWHPPDSERIYDQMPHGTPLSLDAESSPLEATIASPAPYNDFSVSSQVELMQIGAQDTSSPFVMQAPVWHATPSSNLLHVPTLLVEYYFDRVCRDCSMFDSTLNPFRSMVATMRHQSACLNFAIQSLAASKLADDMPRMRVIGIETQGKAIQMLLNDCLATTSLHLISDEVLCAILLLGMTTSWHARQDLGLGYILQARRIVTARKQSSSPVAKTNLKFFEKALIYWTMIIRLVSGDTDDVEESPLEHTGTAVTRPSATKIMPHPWTGVAHQPLKLFGQVMQLVRKTRASARGKGCLDWSKTTLSEIASTIAAAEQLERECWNITLPAVEDLHDTKDPDTPPIDHILTAKAYILATLLHIYMIFPDVLEYRINSLSSSEHHDMIPYKGHSDSGTCGISFGDVWPGRSSRDSHQTWLLDVGVGIIECLEAINPRSGTKVVHPPLLLSVSSALVFPRHTAHDDLALVGVTESHAEVGANSPAANSWHTKNQVRRCRTFVITRLETMHAAMRFHAIDNILKVNKTVWERADTGSKDVFWMDVMYELGCETLFG